MAYRPLSSTMQAMLDRLRRRAGWASVADLEKEPKLRGKTANTLDALVRLGLAEQCRGQYRAAQEKP